MPITLSLATLRGWLILFVGLLATGGFAAELADDVLLFEDPLGVHFFFGLSYEENLPTWYISCLLFSCAFLLSLTALKVRATGSARPGYWWGLAAAFAYISLDEFAQLHEEVSNWFDFGGGIFHFDWVVPAAVVVALLGLLYIPFLLRLPKKTRLRFVLAGVIYVGAALGMELPLGYWASIHGADNFGYGMIDLVEETLEIVGISIFLFALADHLCGDGAVLRLTLGSASEQPVPEAVAPIPSARRQVLGTGAIAAGTLVLWLLFIQLLQFQEFGRRLNDEDIRATVSDRTLFGAFSGDGLGVFTWVQYFIPDGRVVFFMDDELLSSTWRIQDDKLCFQTEDEGETLEDCLRVYEKDGAIQFVIPTLASLGDLVATAERSEAGNVEDMPVD